MSNFYDQWLNYWNEEEEERTKARKCINEEEFEWVRTKQDYRAALVCSRENGFITPGAVVLAVIPEGWHTGKRANGEEAIYIISGKGFTVVDNKRYDWEAGSCLFMPYGAIHQHFNSGEEEVRYLSAMQIGLERYAGLAKIIQYEEAAETPLRFVEDIKKAASAIHPKYGRIVLRAEEAPSIPEAELPARWAKRKDEFWSVVSEAVTQTATTKHRTRIIDIMTPENGFKAREVEITEIYCDNPGVCSSKHGHMEALLYILQGEGYSIVGDEKVTWKKGSLIQVPGPQTPHQHFTTGTVESQQLRIHYGLRAYFFQSIAKRMFPYVYYKESAP